MTQIAAVVFDKDGTLFDFQATWGAWAYDFLMSEAHGDPFRLATLARVLGYDIERRAFMGHSVVIAEPVDAVAGALLPHFPADTAQSLLARINALAAQAPQVSAADLPLFLKGLRARGLKLGVATNDAEAPARAHLTEAGVVDLFDFIAGYDSGHGAKPAPGQLSAFAASVGVPPGACLMVGDSGHDLRAARAAGMAAVGVLTGMAGTQELGPLADAVLPSIADLPAWLDAQGENRPTDRM